MLYKLKFIIVAYFIHLTWKWQKLVTENIIVGQQDGECQTKTLLKRLKKTFPNQASEYTH